MMKYLDNYLNKIVSRGNSKLAGAIKQTAYDVEEKYLKSFSFMDHEIGLLLGNIQSGKTGQMFGILCSAADIGFPVFLILTTDNVILQQQTIERVKADLDGFVICGENDIELFTDNNLIEPAIIVLKKNARILKLWANVFNSTGFMKGNPLFIIDDEADAASLNTLVNKKEQSSINRYLENIKNSASSSLYLQVTGTPQAIFLQTRASGWHPYFTYYFHPGESYLGGDFFFPESGKPDCIIYLDTLENPIRNVVIRHIAVSAQILLSGGEVSNCLFHPSVRVAAHKSCAKKIEAELTWCRNNPELFKRELSIQYRSLSPIKTRKKLLEDIWSEAEKIIDNQIKILIMNGKNNVEGSEYLSGCNFVIGGNTLGRGVTFPGLHTIYYTRTSKNPQADTMWQHSRMFGYDRDPGMMRVYIDERLYKIFSDINATNNSIIAQVEKNINDVKVYYPGGLNPTRKNVLDNKYVAIISGGTNYYPYYPNNDSIEDISMLLEKFSDQEPYYQVSLRITREILSHIISDSDFKVKAFQSILDTMLSERSTAQGILIVRRGRNITQGTGALLSPNDWQLGKKFSDKVVLTMYQVTGQKGWNGKHLWIPNIKLPDGVMYYDVSEEVYLNSD